MGARLCRKPVMVNFVCQSSRAMGYPSTWSDIILRVAAEVLWGGFRKRLTFTLMDFESSRLASLMLKGLIQSVKGLNRTRTNKNSNNKKKVFEQARTLHQSFFRFILKHLLFYKLDLQIVDLPPSVIPQIYFLSYWSCFSEESYLMQYQYKSCFFLMVIKHFGNSRTHSDSTLT